MLPSGRRIWLFTFILCNIPFLFARAHAPTPFARHNGVTKRDALSDSGLKSASWIWTSGATVGNVAFLKSFTSAGGKTASSATITMTAVNQFTLWVNGKAIGASGDGADDWKTAQVFNAALSTPTTTFSVLAVNKANAGGPAPALLAAIQIKYSDGSSETITSDSSWRVSAIIPSDFPTPSDVSRFVAASAAASFGSGVWGSSVAVAAADPSTPPLSGSSWIWDTPIAATTARAGTAGFRKTVASPRGKSATSAVIVITVDNGFSLYVNEKYVGAPEVDLPDFHHPYQFRVALSAASNSFTVFGQNIPAAGTLDAGPAGILAAIRIQYSDGSSDLVGTDASWLTGPFKTVPAFLVAPDASLSRTFAIGAAGAAPWGALSNNFNALAAANIPAAPFPAGTPPQAAVTASITAAAASQTGTTSTAQTTTSASRGSATTSGRGKIDAPASSTRSSANAANSSGSPPPAAAASSSLSTPLIIGLVVALIALIAVCVGLFVWRRKRSSRHKRQSMWLFAANGQTQGGSGSQSQLAAERSRHASLTSEATTAASVRRAEMAWIQPQGALSQGAPSFAPQGFAPQGFAPQNYAPQNFAPQNYAPQNFAPHNYAPQNFTPPSFAPSVPRLEQPRPPLMVHNAHSEPQVTPPTKLAQEHAIWQRNAAAAATAGSTSLAVPGADGASAIGGGALSPQMYGNSRPASMTPSEMNDAYGGIGTPDPEAAPPHYYAQ
ncbi:hypothetical protein B0H15DRAFT_508435 [Mycena belliarum]|uniref:Uncharacterized protein n=1 Tax=Mycena belliarum TaxID=1033014 RepID=A0AAD6UKT7_9AGAR|nr:hypothetical protein B0H15DRAFT_508435 [Mycena belliae]